MRRLILGIVAINACIAIAYAQEGLTVVTGRFSVDHDYATQVFAVENRSDKTYQSVGVECGFYNGSNELVGSGTYYVGNIEPASTAHADVTTNHAADATYARCRIVLTK
jgi:hypothetical protein